MRIKAPPAKVAKTESDVKKVAEDAPNNGEEEKMEVDAEVAVEVKEDKKVEEKKGSNVVCT